ncbi:MAG TPA: trypsin-like peptidase domain-containing protein [Thermoguttaceae bacterium]
MKASSEAISPLLVLCLLAIVCCFVPGGLAAQETLPASLESRKTLTAEKQAQLRQELERYIAVLEAQSAILKTVTKLVGPSVVFIESEHDINTRQSRQQTIQEDGSGVIINWKGKFYILTNRHVIRNAQLDGVKIDLADGRRITPDKIWSEEATDVAVMALSAPDLVAAPAGDSDKMEVGDFVLAMGSPFGLSQSFTYGIISAKGRRNLKLGQNATIQDFLQTDAAINPGNSGGPLVNLHGEVIGINTAIASNSGFSEGCGFAIPMNMFMFVARQLIETGKVTRAFMGVNLNGKFGPADAEKLGLPRLMGAQVSAVTSRSPAEAAKLQPGDVILEFNHTAIEDDGHLVNVVGTAEVGTTVPVLIFRDRKTFSVQIELFDKEKFNSNN